MSEGRNPAKVRKQVEFWGDDYQWFESSHHGASLSWLFSILIHSYREVCTNPEIYGTLPDVTATTLSLKAAELAKEEVDK